MPQQLAGLDVDGVHALDRFGRSAFLPVAIGKNAGKKASARLLLKAQCRLHCLRVAGSTAFLNIGVRPVCFQERSAAAAFRGARRVAAKERPFQRTQIVQGGGPLQLCLQLIECIRVAIDLQSFTSEPAGQLVPDLVGQRQIAGDRQRGEKPGPP